MGNVVSSSHAFARGSATADSYVAELVDVRYERSLGSSRFMKTIRCAHKEGTVVVKVFLKPESALSLQKYKDELRTHRALVSEIPNVLYHQRILETDRAAYLVRRFVFSSLYDRVATRPFLHHEEKRWIAFQLLTVVAECHARGVCHGDIKAENVVVTSWGWVYLVDFAPFKPAVVPEDNPADFSFFFDSSGRRSCYLAPERFVSASSSASSPADMKLTPAMDLFAVGCVIAELFLEHPLFSLSQLLRYRDGAYDPASDLKRIHDQQIRDLILHMIHRDPSQRLSAAAYLSQHLGTLFPTTFSSTLHPLVASVSRPLTPPGWALSPSNGGPRIIPEADERVSTLYADWSSWAVDCGLVPLLESGSRPARPSDSFPSLRDPDHLASLPASFLTPSARACALACATLVSSQVRAARFPRTRLACLDLLSALSPHLTSSELLDRVLPLAVLLVRDPSDSVRARAVVAVAQVLAGVTELGATDAGVVGEYVGPAVRGLARDSSAVVREAWARCLGGLGESALRFLELSQSLRSPPVISGNHPSPLPDSYDDLLRETRDLLADEANDLLPDPDPSVRRALLGQAARLAVVLGRNWAIDVMVGHVVTYLNDREWRVRSAFFDAIPSLVTFLGKRALSEYFLPLIAQALTDPDEYVLDRCIKSLAGLLELGLIGRREALGLCPVLAPMLVHPGVRVRLAAIGYFTASAKALPLVDVRCVVFPAIKPFLNAEVAQLTGEGMADTLKPPVSRAVFELVASWLAKAPRAASLALDHSWNVRGVSSRHRKTASTGTTSTMEVSGGAHSDADAGGGSFGGSSTGDKEADSLLARLRALDVTDSERESVNALRPWMVKMISHRSVRQGTSGGDSERPTSNAPVALRTLGLTPQTIFLSPPSYPKEIIISLDDQRPSTASRDGPLSSSDPPDRQSTASDNGTSAVRQSLYSRLSSIAGAEGSLPSSSHLRPQLSRRNMTDIGSGSNLSPNDDSTSDAFDFRSVDERSEADRSESVAGTASVSNATGGAFTGRTTRSPQEDAQVSRQSYGATLGVSVPTRPGSSAERRLARNSSPGSPLISKSVPVKSLAQASLSLDTGIPTLRVKSMAPALQESFGRTGSINTGSRQFHRSSNSFDSLQSSSIGSDSAGMPMAQIKGESYARSKLQSAIGRDDKVMKTPPPGWETGDRFLKALLDKKSATLFPPPLDLGTTALSKGSTTSYPVPRRTTDISALKNWKPDGTHIATFHEHTGAVNHVRMSPDNNFFATASDDGTVKIWDTVRLEKNVTNHSRLTHKQGGKIKALTFCEGTHGIASASDNGSIHVSRVEYIPSTSSTLKYRSFDVVRTRALENDSVTWLEHFGTDMSSVLVYSTKRGHICGFDLRTMKVEWEMKCPAHYGIPTSLAMDPTSSWILSGSSRGIFTLWDIRFALPLRSWSHPTQSRIHRLASWSPIRMKGRGVLASVEGRTNEVSLWDVEKAECRELWCVVGGTGDSSQEDNVEALYGKGVKAGSVPEPHDFSLPSSRESTSTQPSRSSLALYPAPDASFLLTAGTDRKIRFWDHANADDSYVMCGPPPSEEGAPHARYSTRQHEGVLFHMEYAAPGVLGSTGGSLPRINRAAATLSVGSGGSGITNGQEGREMQQQWYPPPATGSSGLGRSSWPAVLAHRDAVTDITVTTVPYPMVLTGGRDGVVKVWK
ncbi:hypothetical protein M427DRAFT_145085 [Gonapodya prolifera JEL478]|uniref:non-specific serine/threonine protein kinase n=1 Tax=Gonapodya prolifera (strain JEL478) TaxID=1344416 RepID=A0A139AH71_GONPJ|nr:hypothetical protein M427DRAFT_145085 [Gonapodya prolifera JEL478]|eukprot:KXS16088.1 hypothetical protein M427DRAFT_145085 [Gonapodya prolifera JEL478]